MLTRRNLTYLAVLDVILFLVSNLTAKNNTHPGTVSNVCWVAFLLGVVALIVVAIAIAARSSRRRASG